MRSAGKGKTHKDWGIIKRNFVAVQLCRKTAQAVVNEWYSETPKAKSIWVKCVVKRIEKQLKSKKHITHL